MNCAISFERRPMIRSAVVWILLVGTSVMPRPVEAQRWIASSPRVRVTLAGAPAVIGSLSQKVADTVEFLPEAGFKPLHIPVARIRRLEISRGRSSAAAKGLILGAATGVALAATLALMSPRGSGELTQGQLFVAAATGLGILGMGTGVVVGAFYTVENWERAQLPFRPGARAAYEVRPGLTMRIIF